MSATTYTIVMTSVFALAMAAICWWVRRSMIEYEESHQ